MTSYDVTVVITDFEAIKYSLNASTVNNAVNKALTKLKNLLGKEPQYKRIKIVRCVDGCSWNFERG